MNLDSRLVTTRRSLHGVAELVLAGPQHAQTGEISLRSVPGGFAHDAHAGAQRRRHRGASAGRRRRHQRAHPRVAGRGARASRRRRCPRSTPTARASVRTTRSRSTPRPPPRSRTPSPPATRPCASLAPDETPILWPEHFDIGISVGEVNYGVSAGDGYLAVPYAYVGPWSPPAQDDYWNAPFGRAVPVDEIDDPPARLLHGRSPALGRVLRDVIRSGRPGDPFV